MLTKCFYMFYRFYSHLEMSIHCLEVDKLLRRLDFSKSPRGREGTFIKIKKESISAG